MRALRPYLWPILILLIVRILFLFPFFHALDYKAQDSLFRLRGAQEISNDIVIITIDDATDSALDTRWPYPREYHAKLIENLFKLGVKQVIFDVAFTESA
ncbi:MAG TPA: CHASE2 domain-containing protein, partial [Candidatus Cloacimonadota bacterium]|nr:CHASE2 domain-containing protein [Candidatus Cloacimonadota bacterium]